MIQADFLTLAKRCCVLILVAMSLGGCAHSARNHQERPLQLIQALPDGELKADLLQCDISPFTPTDLSIAHRGAPAIFPQHSNASYRAAAAMGAGIIECDVVATQDGELVCRHEQCDLHATTDILLRPELAQKCSQPFIAATNGRFTKVKCCTSDITLSEFKSLCGVKTQINKNAKTPDKYLNFKEPLTECDPLMSFSDSIKLIQKLNRKMAPELKRLENSVYVYINGVSLPLSKDAYREKFIQTLRHHRVKAEDVWLQSFNLDDIQYWQKNAAEYAEKLIWLDGRYYSDKQFKPNLASSWNPSMQALKEQGLTTIAPPIWVLLTVENGRWIPSEYAKAAKASGLNIIAWTTEKYDEAWYYRNSPNLRAVNDSLYELLDVLIKDIGVIGVFSDNPATTSYYANCRTLQ